MIAGLELFFSIELAEDGAVFLHSDCCGRVTDDSQRDKSPPLFSPFWRPDRAATFAVPIKGATKAAAFGIVQCMQVLCTVANITTYMAACNPFDVVARPEGAGQENYKNVK